MPSPLRCDTCCIILRTTQTHTMSIQWYVASMMQSCNDVIKTWWRCDAAKSYQQRTPVTPLCHSTGKQCNARCCQDHMPSGGEVWHGVTSGVSGEMCTNNDIGDEVRRGVTSGVSYETSKTWNVTPHLHREHNKSFDAADPQLSGLHFRPQWDRLLITCNAVFMLISDLTCDC